MEMSCFGKNQENFYIHFEKVGKQKLWRSLDKGIIYILLFC